MQFQQFFKTPHAYVLHFSIKHCRNLLNSTVNVIRDCFIVEYITANTILIAVNTEYTSQVDHAVCRSI